MSDYEDNAFNEVAENFEDFDAPDHFLIMNTTIHQQMVVMPH